MSKPAGKGKDKKKQPDSQLGQLVEQQKRQILELTFTVRKLQDRLSQLTQQNYEIVSTKDKFHADYEQKIDKSRVLIQSHQATIKQKSNKIYQLQVERINLKNKISNLQRDLRQSQLMRQRQFQEYKKLTQNEIVKLQTQLKEYNFYMNEKTNMELENNQLRSIIQQEKQSKIKQLADKQREKIQTTDKLRDQMLTKIRDMRTSLLSLKKEQLSTTTRLAVLQNHQLTSELEFQSKQSQKLVFQNENLLKKVSGLQKDLEIHKEIQQQLAKRAHYSRGIIKKLTSKIGELQQELQNKKKQIQDLTSSSTTGNNKKQNNNNISQSKFSPKHNATTEQQQQIIRTLDKSLQYTQKKYHKLQIQVAQLKQQYEMTKVKLEKFEKYAEDICGLMIKYYEGFLIGKNQGGKDNNNTVDESQIVYDLKALRARKVEEWRSQQVRLVVLILLNNLAPRINKRLLGIPTINKNLINAEDADQLIPKIKFPRISEHSAINGNFNRGMHSSSSALDIKKVKDYPVTMASKIVSSNVREWGRTVHANSMASLNRKYKINYEK